MLLSGMWLRRWFNLHHQGARLFILKNEPVERKARRQRIRMRRRRSRASQYRHYELIYSWSSADIDRGLAFLALI